ncbi:hypothetical protein [Bradyrhizobium sp. Leo121]|uniref:hypothetical protein n=1 Tax=Bradyrhizobium sp. Leo121 TaxID=1571195 RepID=UPI0010289830|nr:hypothetical protein [Bradyrhizobium sp. Leo121]RZN32307.1 hypothetical protein CWO90_13965 [Bradyrhizobium sp. Leo121]
MKIYYRLEQERDYFLIKHVETDCEVGYAFYGEAVRPDGTSFDVCRIFNNAGQELAAPTSLTCEFPIRCAAQAVAAHEKHYGFPDLKGATRNADVDRVERRLGILLADSAAAFARAFCEALAKGLTDATKEKFAGSLAELSSIWWVSRVGCFDATNGVEEPYFANPISSEPRLTFSGAAQAYGMREMRKRHPDLNDAERQKLLSWVLQWLDDALSNELAEQQKELAGLRAWLNNQKASASRSTRPTVPRRQGVIPSVIGQPARIVTLRP